MPFVGTGKEEVELVDVVMSEPLDTAVEENIVATEGEEDVIEVELESFRAWIPPIVPPITPSVTTIARAISTRKARLRLRPQHRFRGLGDCGVANFAASPVHVLVNVDQSIAARGRGTHLRPPPRLAGHDTRLQMAGHDTPPGDRPMLPATLQRPDMASTC
jgi:hypothetical protein